MKSNKKTVVYLSLLAIFMIGLTYSFVPLYNTFCKLVGIPVASIAVRGDIKQHNMSDRSIDVRFIAASAADIPVEFLKKEKLINVKLGENVLTAYEAKNISADDVKGVAVHQLIGLGLPAERDVAEYVNLMQCFCFDEQIYPAGRDISMPLSFSVSDELPEGIHTVVFSYTLFPVKD